MLAGGWGREGAENMVAKENRDNGAGLPVFQGWRAVVTPGGEDLLLPKHR